MPVEPATRPTSSSDAHIFSPSPPAGRTLSFTQCRLPFVPLVDESQNRVTLSSLKLLKQYSNHIFWSSPTAKYIGVTLSCLLFHICAGIDPACYKGRRAPAQSRSSTIFS
jgi:hypothetical protein